MAWKFAEIEELKQKANKIEEIKLELHSINHKIKSIEV